MDVEKLVGIDMQKPAQVRHTGLSQDLCDTRDLRRRRAVVVIADMGDLAQSLQPITDQIGPVGAIIGDDEHSVEADQPMIGCPFDDEEPLVAHACHDRVLHQPVPMIRIRSG